MVSDIKRFTCTIANGASLSDAIHLEGYTPVAILMPAAWTAAVLSFQGSEDHSTFLNLYDMEVEILANSAGASRYIRLQPAHFIGLVEMKIRSGTSGSAVNQGAERTLTVLGREL